MTFIIDPPAADVVRHVFQLFSEGIGFVRITKILREENILNPQHTLISVQEKSVDKDGVKNQLIEIH